MQFEEMHTRIKKLLAEASDNKSLQLKQERVMESKDNLVHSLKDQVKELKTRLEQLELDKAD